MSATATATARDTASPATDRRDAWWLGPVAIGTSLAAFIVYATYRAVMNDHYEVTIGNASILSPFYSPKIVLPAGMEWLSPALLILWLPAGFRVTCYYFRRAYYRAYFGHPLACGVSERARAYGGETAFPLILQNLHRYFLYGALVLLVFHWKDVAMASRDGVGSATIVLGLDALLLTFYVFSCHSLRHLVGGGVDCFARAALGECRYAAWRTASRLNAHHAFWAWTSLFMVGFADFYVWMLHTERIGHLMLIPF